MPTPKKLNRRSPMSIMQQYGSENELRSLQRKGQASPGASREAGDTYNQNLYKMMKHVEGKRSRGGSASYERGGSVDYPYSYQPNRMTPQELNYKMRELNAQRSAASKSRYASSEDQDSDISRIEREIEYLSEYMPVRVRRVSDDKGNIEYKAYGKGGEIEEQLAKESKGGMGASAVEDLLEKLGQYKKSNYGNKYNDGGEVKGDKEVPSSIKIAGQYAVDSIKTTPEGNQYVSMELPDGKVVPVFGDWETYGNPDQEGRIEDLDYRIYPLGDGTYSLDAGEMESEMHRDENRKFGDQAVGGMGASPTEDLLERLNQARGMGRMPNGRMRPIKR